MCIEKQRSNEYSLTVHLSHIFIQCFHSKTQKTETHIVKTDLTNTAFEVDDIPKLFEQNAINV